MTQRSPWSRGGALRRGPLGRCGIVAVRREAPGLASFQGALGAPRGEGLMPIVEVAWFVLEARGGLSGAGGCQDWGDSKTRLVLTYRMICVFKKLKRPKNRPEAIIFDENECIRHRKT